MDSRRLTAEQLRDAYRMPGFTPSRTITGVDGDPSAVSDRVKFPSQ
jgi:hypothetical protein